MLAALLHPELCRGRHHRREAKRGQHTFAAKRAVLWAVVNVPLHVATVRGKNALAHLRQPRQHATQLSILRTIKP